MAKKSTMSTQDMAQAAEAYLDQTESYKAVTLQHLANFLGVGIQVVNHWLSIPRWEQLQRSWIEKRLRLIMEAIYTDAKTQEDFSIEKIASYAGIPSSIAHVCLTELGWKELCATLPDIRKKSEPQAEPSMAHWYIHQAEIYLTQAKAYKEVTAKHFAEFLGVADHILYRRFPNYQWDMLRNRWIQNRLKQAMDVAYAEAKTQGDFTLKHISERAKIPYLTVHRFLAEDDEWQARLATLPKRQKTLETTSYYLQQAEIYLAQTQCYEDVMLKRFAEFLGKSPVTVTKRLSNHQWEQLRNRWIENRLQQARDAVLAEAEAPTIANIARRAGIPPKTVRRHLPEDVWLVHQKRIPWKHTSSLQQLWQAMDEIYAEAKTQEDFTVSKLVEMTGIPHTSANRLIGDELRSRQKTLPTTKEKVLAALQTLVDAGISVNELTRQHVVKLADVNGEGSWPWFNQPYHAARRQLALRPAKQIAEPPPGVNVRIIPGGWVDIDECIWDLRPTGNRLLRQDKLRDDFADIAWSLLQEELRSPEVALGTIDHHYFGFTKLDTFLGDEIPDVRQATLLIVQQRWMSYQIRQSQRQLIRQCLVQIFEVLARLAEHDDTINGIEMRSISTWLQTTIKIGRTAPGEDFLSEDELNAVLRGCLSDIAAGITYINTQPDLLTISVNPNARENAVVVVRWAVALMVLVMAFTGLRRESVLNLKTNDWAEVHTGLFALAWRHNKKGEENVAVLPADLAQLLQMYVHCTSPIRIALATEYVFLTNNMRGHWQVLSIPQFSPRLQEFAERHHLKRDGLSLPLSSTVLRRTYTTLALYEGRNIAALRAQLGHIHFESTLRYVKFDRFKHPAEVGASLDEYGRKALTLWQKPLILEDLDPDERMSLLGAKVKHRQDVGLCRHEECIKAIQGSPPPCSLCEHLVTGPEFFDAWQAERLWRKKTLEQLAQKPELGVVLAQMKSQFERFEKNFTFVQERIHT